MQSIPQSEQRFCVTIKCLRMFIKNVVVQTENHMKPRHTLEKLSIIYY
jgi:hypothetical protein